MSEQEDKVNEFVDYIKIYHVYKSTVQSFKTFCKQFAGDKFNIGLKILLDTHKEKESYFFLMSEVSQLRAEVDRLTTLFAATVAKRDDNTIKIIGGEIKLNDK